MVSIWIITSWVTRLQMIVLFLLTFAAIFASGSDDPENNSGFVHLDVYLDDDGASLITGWVDSAYLEELSFLGGVEYSYDALTGEFLALDNSLGRSETDGIHLELSVGADIGSYALNLYLPKGSEIVDMSCSNGIDYYYKDDTDSTVVEIIGYDVESPNIKIIYK